MVKIRKAEKRELTTEQIESFARGADNSVEKVIESLKVTDTNAKHDFKSIRVGMNQYEYDLITNAAKSRGLTKVGFIRYAAMKMSKEDQ